MAQRREPTTPGGVHFWELAGELLERAEVEESTMMGYPCLRVGGEFFTSTDPTTGDLIVKVPETRVDDLIDAGHARPFAPAGRRFREWAAVPFESADTWPALLDEALEFVSALPPRPRRTRKPAK